LPAITVCSYALSEAGSGSDAFRACNSGARGWQRLRAECRKLWTRRCGADIFIVFATVDVSAVIRASAFLVERGTPGFSVGKKKTSWGFGLLRRAKLLFDDCRVPAENILGEKGKGYRLPSKP